MNTKTLNPYYEIFQKSFQLKHSKRSINENDLIHSLTNLANLHNVIRASYKDIAYIFQALKSKIDQFESSKIQKDKKDTKENFLLNSKKNRKNSKIFE